MSQSRGHATTTNEKAGALSTGRPLRRDAERNRQRILVAAREVFAARGLDVTLDDIAHHAGLGVGTVYRRYPSREHLVEALFEEQLDQLAAWAAEALTHPDAWEGLRGFMERAVGAMAADRGLRDVLFSRTYGRDHVEQARTRLGPASTALIARARNAGMLRPGIEPSDLPLIQFMLSAAVEYTDQVDPGLWRRYLALMLDGLRSAPEQKAELPHAAPPVDVLNQIARGWKPSRRSSDE